MISFEIARPSPVPLGLSVMTLPICLKPVEDHRLVLGGDADPGVSHVERTKPPSFRRDLDVDTSAHGG